MADIPSVGQPYIVRHWLTVITVECRQCEAGSTVMLVGSQMARCPTCNAPFACGGFEWDSESRPTPKIVIGTTPTIGATGRPF